MISKTDYIWLERHTDILNIVPNLDDYAIKDVKFKVYRPAHLQKIKEIFKNYTCISGKNKNNTWIKVKGFTLDNLNNTAQNYFGYLIYDSIEHGVYYIPTNKKRNQKILRRATPDLLANLSNRKKLDILFSYAQTMFVSEEQQQRRNNFIFRNSDKFQALLNLKIPTEFMNEEYKKVRQIVEKIAAIPDIKSKLSRFNTLPEKEQHRLIEQTCRITAEVNGIEPPKIHYLSQKQINDEKQADWIETDAFAEEKDISINKNFLKKYNGTQCLSLAFHETTHLAQSGSNYTDFPEMEEIFSHHLFHLQNYTDLYISIPSETITYCLEKEFCEKLVEKTNMKIQKESSSYETEYSMARQYLNKYLRRAY